MDVEELNSTRIQSSHCVAKQIWATAAINNPEASRSELLELIKRHMQRSLRPPMQNHPDYVVRIVYPEVKKRSSLHQTSFVLSVQDELDKLFYHSNRT